MKTNEIIAALRQCEVNNPGTCRKCPVYNQSAGCLDLLHQEAAELIEKMAAERRWIPVTERLPDLIPCNAGTAYSEAVIVWTSGRKAMIAVWDGIDFLCAATYWEAEGEDITHWMPMPELPKEER